jgi:hypothetical protein
MYEIILDNFENKPNTNQIPLGPWCFVNEEDLVPDWDEKYEFPIIFESLEKRKEGFNYCLNLFSRVEGKVISKFRNTYGNCLFELSDEEVCHFLRPHIARSALFFYGRMMYIKKFMENKSDSEFQIRIPEKVKYCANDECYFYKKKFQTWLNYKVFQFLDYKNISFYKDNNSGTEQRCHEELNVKDMAPFKGNFQRIYGLGRKQKLILYIINFLKTKLKKSNDVANSKKVPLINNVDKIAISDDLIDHVVDVFFESLPVSMSTGLLSLKNKVLQLLNNHKKIKNSLLFDKIGLHQDELRLFHSYWLSLGGKLAHVQHGAIYESLENHWVSLYIEFQSSYFISWGWDGFQKYSYPAKIIPLPSLALSRIRNKHKQLSDNILFVGAPTYSSYDGVCGLEPQNAVLYRKKKIQFFNKLDSKLLGHIRYREMPTKHENDLCDLKYIVAKGFHLKTQDGHLMTAAFGSRLVVLDYYGTPFFECLVSNTPVVLYLGEHDYMFNEKIEKYISAFKDLGVIHDTPKQAAEFINTNIHNIRTWWHSRKNVELRKEFLKNYGVTKKYPLLSWVPKIWSL